MAEEPFNDPKTYLKTPQVRAFGVFYVQDEGSTAGAGKRTTAWMQEVDQRKEQLPRNGCRGTALLKALTLFCLAGTALANCPPPTEADTEWVRLASVIDGDSLRLSDGRRLRLMGVNAPELVREGRPAQALGPEARDSLRQLLVPGDKLLLAYGDERQDHYGRSLAYVYTDEGQHLASYLVRQGLGFHIAIPPNLSLAGCLAGLEAKARRQELGVWGHKAWQVKPARTLTPADAGFVRIGGRVTQVDDQRDLWLELDGPVVVKIAARDRVRFDRPPEAWLGQRLTLRGWLVDRSGSRATQRGFKPLVMPLRTPFALE